jgi:hypothetical protein
LGEIKSRLATSDCDRGESRFLTGQRNAVAPNKRGSHLALSLERLARLCGDRLLRIGLSATQKPIEEVAWSARKTVLP